MTEYINKIISAFQEASNVEIAKGQSVYMKNHFGFFGIKSPERKALQRPFFLKDQRPAKKDLPQVIKALWEQSQRELQYCGQELALKYLKNQDETYLALYEFMITHKSWWDTVDFIASNLVGNYFKVYPDKKWETCQKWLLSDNLWLQRTSILFQLKYKDKVDTKLLEHNITYLLGSKEFFINKAIGWILREYSKTNPDWVISFAAGNKLDKLSQREAFKWLNRKNQ
jgi:3-methyladenine DNA glycosylase AlkD